MDYLPSILAVAFVILVLFLTLKLLEKRGLARLSFTEKRSAPGALQVEDRLLLGAQHSVSLVRAGTQRLFIVCGPGTCQILALKPDGERNPL